MKKQLNIKFSTNKSIHFMKLIARKNIIRWLNFRIFYEIKLEMKYNISKMKQSFELILTSRSEITK